MRNLVLIALALCALGFSPMKAEAGEQDIGKITCKEFMEDKSGQAMMVMWIDGYMSAKSDNTVINDEWLKKLSNHLGSFCSQYPAKNMMDAMDAMPGE